MFLRRRFLELLPALIVIFCLTGIVEWIVRAGLIPSYLVPAPSQVFHSLLSDDIPFFPAMLETASSAFLGFFASAGLAILISFVLSLYPFLERAFLPIAVFFQTVPIIAIAPLLVIWFGFGAPTVRAAAAIVAFFPILANSLSGLSQTPFDSLELFRSWRARPLKTLLHLKIPQAIPQILTGLEVGIGLSVIGALVGEFVAGSGLGAVIDSARTQQRADVVFASVLLSTLVGLAFVSFIRSLRWLLYRYRPFAGRSS